MSRRVLDASALLALLNGEVGAERVLAALEEGAIISAVNLAEVVGKLADVGLSESETRGVLGPLALAVADFDEDSAYAAGLLRPLTVRQGLSLGDRACLGLALALGLPALTAERSWTQLSLPVAVETIR